MSSAILVAGPRQYFRPRAGTLLPMSGHRVGVDVPY